MGHVVAVVVWAVCAGTAALLVSRLVAERVRTTRAVAAVASGSAADLDELRLRVAAALGDKSVALHCTPDAIAAASATDDPSRLLVRLTGTDGRDVAIVDVARAAAGNSRRVESVTAAVRPALENVLLRRAHAEQLERIRDSRRELATRSMEERYRLERNLHDGAQQALFALSVRLEATRQDVAEPGTRLAIENVRDELRSAHRELRAIASTTFPPALETAGLAAALDDLAERLELVLRLHVTAEPDDSAVSAAAYFSVHDLLVDLDRRTPASSVTAVVRAEQGAQSYVVLLEHDAPPDTVSASVCSLVSERLRALDGTIGSRTDGSWSTTRMEIPCA